MGPFENNVGRTRSRSGLALTLVSATDVRDATEVATAFAGVRPPAPDRHVETDGDDSGDFGLHLAETVFASADAGVTGETVVVLEPSADVMEVALVCEYVLTRREAHEVPVLLREVIAVSSVREILDRFLEIGDAPSDVVDDAPERLAARLEFASTIVLADLEDAPGDARAALALALVERLNPTATVTAVDGVVWLRSLPIARTETRAHRIGAHMGWQLELSSDGPNSSGLVEAAVFRDPRPFHPTRLATAIATELTPSRIGRILRSKGLVRLASRPERVGSWSSAGDLLSLDPTGMTSWDPDSPAGQEIVFFGHRLESELLTDVLSRCLLTPEELLEGAGVWRSYSDPFPAWGDTHHH
ncbi:cobalamin biosynthesis protein CobW [Labedella phragmitis]|uniref:Cobalamin biosynthesis protein CobW n=1 Tax=Labedella phragmitis TaxID=2498849 RepID=A0A444PS51_9MICO|nr:GTP-binding protein [Labedella phragmitis]RWZ50071.1 cobalamin biosynthesis protein CobW [Labedella phragmitis]